MTISCRTAEQCHSPEQLKDIAGLIWDTDPYIYPAMFKSRDEAEIVIPRMILCGDVMFSLKNLFVAEENDRIVGLILWIRGPMNWTPEIYLKCGGSSPYIDRIHKEYFALYQHMNPDVTSLINVCVSAKKRGAGIGHLLLREFLKQEHGICELYVLADNPGAVHLYEKHGFRITEKLQGFSVEPMDLLCYRMINPGMDNSV